MYNRIESEKMLIELYNYKSCGGKHEENLFTRWYQAFYLFNKFGIDKRKCFYSSLINADQMDRKTAMQLLAEPPTYERLNIDEVQVMKYKKRSHEEFKTDKWFGRMSKVIRFLRKWKF